MEVKSVDIELLVLSDNTEMYLDEMIVTAVSGRVINMTFLVVSRSGYTQVQ